MQLRAIRIQSELLRLLRPDQFRHSHFHFPPEVRMFVSGLEGLPLSLLKECRQNLLKPLEDGGVGLTSSTSGRCKGTRKRSWFKPALNHANTSTQPRTTTYQRIKTEEGQPCQRRVGVPAKQAWAPRGAGAPAPLLSHSCL